MTADEIKDYCRSKKMITEENPFGDIPICFKLKGRFLHNYILMNMIIKSH